MPASGYAFGMVCRHPLTVRFGECDPAGIVYMPRILHYFHVASEELFAAVTGTPSQASTMSGSRPAWRRHWRRASRPMTLWKYRTMAG